MGASASIELVFADGIEWFRTYFDKELYIQDFETMDKDKNGGISYKELEAWLKEKAKEGGVWKDLITKQHVIKTAHEHSAQHLISSQSGKRKEQVFSIIEFSILWTHFKSADQWLEGHDIGNEILSFDEFRLACKTFCYSHAHEKLTDEQIRADFGMLDTDHSNALPFSEVSSYVCNFIDEKLHLLKYNEYDENLIENDNNNQNNNDNNINDILASLPDPESQVTRSVDDKNDDAFSAIVNDVLVEQETAEYLLSTDSYLIKDMN
eukprot:gene7309-9957_t